MQGTFYQTLTRNELTGETDFLFSPLEYCEETVDGLIRCRGQTGIFHYKLPLVLDGEFHNHVFYVRNAKLMDGEAGTEKLLTYLSERIPLTTPDKNKISKAAGGDLLGYIREHPQDFMEVLEDKQKLKGILQECKRLNEQADVTSLCIKHGITFGQVERLLKVGATMKSLSKNAYLPFLYADIPVYTADSVMQELDPQFTPYQPVRILGYVADAMKINGQCGNTCITPEALCRLINRRMKKSGLGGEVSLAMLNYIVLKKEKMFSHLTFRGNVYLYESHVLEEENTVIRNIFRLNRNRKTVVDQIDIPAVEKKTGFSFTQGQREALSLLKTSGVKLLIGPPGSGKTALERALLEIYQEHSGKKGYRLAATTGRAAQVMAEACHATAETIHRLLDIRPFGESLSSKDENHPIECEFIIVDEVSMLDLKLFSMLLKAIKSGSILLMVGDKHQLQSVAYGNVLKDLEESGMLETYELTEIMRQSGVICSNAQMVNKGNIGLVQAPDFHIRRYDRKEDLLKDLWSFRRGGGMIMTTIKKTELGTEALNRRMQESRYQGQPFIEYGMKRFCENDWVIMTETDYAKGYYNGDIGVVKEIKDYRSMVVAFTNQTLVLEKEDFIRMDLAYAITVHRAQGSEFKTVHIVLPMEHQNMLTRRILYTAMTRAKKNVYLYLMGEALEVAASNRSEAVRNTLLKDRLMTEKET